MTAPTLYDLAATATFDENTVNATPQLLDADVTFVDVEGDFDGGVLQMLDLLPEDTVSVRNQGDIAGQIGFDGTTVSFGGTVIGTLVGGAGTDLTITFNADATSAAIDALIQNLTYANSSDGPTTSRTLFLNVIDAAGNEFDFPTSFAPLTGADSPLDSVTVGEYSRPSFVDLNADGDLDLVVGGQDGTLLGFVSDGAGGFTELTGTDNPFDGLDVGSFSAPSFGDLDGDGDFDLVVGEYEGTLRSFANDGAGVFTELTGTDNPFDGVDVGWNSTPSFVDLDEDGDWDLVIGSVFGNTLDTFLNDGTGVFTEVSGVANPLDTIDPGLNGMPSFVDLDNDGHPDLVLGSDYDFLLSFINDGAGGYTELIGMDNPFNGLEFSLANAPAFADLDGDGDQDLVVGKNYGAPSPTFDRLNVYENTTPRGLAITVEVAPQNDAPPDVTNLPTSVTVLEDTLSDLDLVGLSLSDIDVHDVLTVVLSVDAGTLSAANGTGVSVTGTGTSALSLAGTASAIETYLNASSTIGYTGAQDATGDAVATLILTGNDGSGVVNFGSVAINITNENDVPVVSDLPLGVTVLEGTRSDLDLSALTLSDVDTTGDITVGLNASSGVLTAANGAGVIVTGSGTGALSLVGTVTAIDTYLNSPSAVRYLGLQDVAGDAAATLTLTGDDGSGVVIVGSADLNITPNDAPLLIGLGSTMFAENTVNATPQLLDADVDFSDFENNFDGGSLRLTGVLAEDTVSLFDQGDSAGQIGFDGTTVSFGGTAIGMLAGGAGTDLTVTFNADATSVAIDALIQNLTYANSSDAPTPSRDFILSVTDEAGDGLDNPNSFALLFGTDNPFNGLDVGSLSAPSFGDLDGDDDLDLVIGEINGTLRSFASDGIGGFTELTGTDNPFDGVDVGWNSTPIFVDLDGDEDVDLVVGENGGSLRSFANDGAGGFTELTGIANPFDGIDEGGSSAPIFVDLDGNIDLDLVVGDITGKLFSFTNDGAGGFLALDGVANPFAGIDVGVFSTPSFVDLEDDGDLDLVVGSEAGTLFSYVNDGAGGFTALAGADNPFNAVNVGAQSAPSFFDLNADGNLDLVLGNTFGTLLTLENTTQQVGMLTVEITVQNDAPPVMSNLPTSVTVLEDTLSDLDLGGLTLSDIDVHDVLTIVLGVDSGTLSAANGTGVTVTGSGTNALGLMGTAAAIESYLNTPSTIRYTGVQDAIGDAAATLTLTGDDGSGVVNLGSVDINITNVNDTPVVTGLPANVTVLENTPSDLDLSALTLSDVDTTGDITVVLDVSAGTLTAANGSGVTVTGSGTSTLSLVGTVSSIDSYFNTPSAITYTGAPDAVGFAAATLTLSADDGSGSVPLGTGNIGILSTSEAPKLFGLDTAIFTQDTVSISPQLLDASVDFSDSNNDFDGGSLHLTGLLAEDTVSVRHQGSASEQIGFDGTTVSYSGTAFGTFAGGAGTDITIAFNSDATSVAIDALIQNLTYANVSDTPTASRNLRLNVTDAAGNGVAIPSSFVPLIGAENPFNGMDVGENSTLGFVDLDGDTDLDLVVGNSSGTLLSFRNDGAGAFTELTGTDNPFDGLDVIFDSAPAFVDLDQDADLDLVVGSIYGTLLSYENDGAGGFAELPGVANPFNDVDVGWNSIPRFADLDGDGDLDLAVGESLGTLHSYANNGAGGFSALTGVANPFEGVNVSSSSAPGFVDLDGDGYLDLVVGEYYGALRSFVRAGLGGFIELTGTDNPFDGVDVGAPHSAWYVGDRSTPRFVDLDGDGDLDLVAGAYSGGILAFENTTPQGIEMTVEVTSPSNASPVMTGLPTSVTAFANTLSDFNLTDVTLSDVDTAGDITVVLSVSAGTLTATNGGGVTVSGSGTSNLSLVGTASAIDTYLNTASAVGYIGALDAVGDAIATLTLTGDDGAGIVTFGTVDINVVVVDGPVLSGLGSVTFAENAVNTTPQLLDIEVDFTSFDGDFDGGSLRVFGLLAEDTISVRDQGSSAGQIGFDGSTITYGGTSIGALTGGAGADLTITFNANTTSVAVDALIQNLTFANASDVPTASRDLFLNVTNAAGSDLGTGGPASFDRLSGAANPFDGIDVGRFSTPSFVDLDGDDDLDLVIGSENGDFVSYENDGAGGFTQLIGTDNPFDGINVGYNSSPAFVDLDGDGDFDLVSGEVYAEVLSYENNGGGGFVQLTGADNPFSSLPYPNYDSRPSFVDLDADGDQDLVVGGNSGTLFSYENDGAGGFTRLLGANNPFDGIDVGYTSSPGFVDLDGDGDLDLVSGHSGDTLLRFENDGAGGFTPLTGSDNPFSGVNVYGDVNNGFAPSFVDLDDDGDLDLVLGNRNGTLLTLENTSQSGRIFTVDITPENDAPTLIGLPVSVNANTNMASELDLSGVTLFDPDLTDVLTVVLSGSAGSLEAASRNGVTVTGSGTSTLSLVGTAGDIDAYLNASVAVQYTSAPNVFGEAAATLTITGDDGGGQINFGTINIDLNDVPKLAGLDPVTFAENTVNATPQLLDLDVIFTDAEGNFDGGTLRLGGLLAEDTVSVRNQGTAAGEIGFDGSDVSYGGTVIGVLTGGNSGVDLQVTFNASATTAAIDALIQNLTYFNNSDAPIASRELFLNVMDAAGAEFDVTRSANDFDELTGSDNPFEGIDVFSNSVPSFVDLDGDGDLDLVLGEGYGTLLSYENDGAGGFVALTGAANPLDSIYVGYSSAPAFVDLDGDGDLDLVVSAYDGTLHSYANEGAGGFTALIGSANPFDGIYADSISAPQFVDLDGDDDLDLVFGENNGTLWSFENAGASGFVELPGALNPFDGIDVGYFSRPSFVDLDGDNDLDLVVGEASGTLLSFSNEGAGGFVALTGSSNPFDGIDVGIGNQSGNPAPSFVDLDGDGDLDLVLGEIYGTLLSYENTSPHGIGISVTVTPENDGPPMISGDQSVAVMEGGVVVLTTADLAASDIDDDDETLTYSVSTLVAGTVHVNGATASSFTHAQLSGGAVSFVHDGSETTVGSFDASVEDSDGGVSPTVTVIATIEAVNDSPTLSGFSSSFTFDENTVNATPRLLDADVSFADAEDNFDGGLLSLSGLLPEDSVSVRNQGSGLGEVGFDGTNVSYGNVVIGALSGGTAGADLEITLNAAATSAAIEALIQNLTYANSSNAPTTSRDLFLNVTDAAGGHLGPEPGDAVFTALDGAANPFDQVIVGVPFTQENYSTPSFVDLDNDGDLDLVVGEYEGYLTSYRNDGSGIYSRLDGSANPFDGISVYTNGALNSATGFVDLDEDGDLDLVIGERYGGLLSYENDGAFGFSELTGADNPLSGINVGMFAKPSFVDLDGDGVLDLVVGSYNGTLNSFANDGAGGFTENVGVENPFDGIDVGENSSPDFVDLDWDGDLDLIIGQSTGHLRGFVNDGQGGYTALDTITHDPILGAVLSGPFGGLVLSSYSAPVFVDIDGDGDLDLVVGGADGEISSVENLTPNPLGFSIAVTPENDAPTSSGLPVTIAGNEDEAFDVDLSGILLTDPDASSVPIALTLQASTGRIDLAAGAGVSVFLTGTNTALVYGTASALETYLQNSGSVRYTGAQDVFGDDVATLTLIGSDGLAQTNFGTIAINLADVADTVIGGSKNDRLIGGSGMDSLIGNGGHDTLVGFGGADTIEGGLGNDAIRADSGADRLSGGAGIDIVQYHRSGSGVTVDLTVDEFGFQSASGGDATGDILSGFERVRGSVHDDTLIGNDENNRLIGSDGADTIDGGLGNDEIRGGAGADSLVGGAGIDRVKYYGSQSGVTVDLNVDETGFQSASGGDATGDILEGFEGAIGSVHADTLIGNAANNRLVGGGGADTIDGGLGNDEIRGSAGADILSGGDGVDWALYFGSETGVVVDLNVDEFGFQFASGGDATGDVLSGFERVRGSVHDDTLIGNDENNRLIGSDGADTIEGGLGNDEIRGGAGADSLAGGGGIDRVQYYGSQSGVTVDLNVDETGFQSASGGDATGDILEGFEGAVGSVHADTLIGNAANNRLVGGGGSDTIDGGLGKDVIYGGDGYDNLTGGGGSDTFIFDTSLGDGNVDHVIDFNTSGDDRFKLDDADFIGMNTGDLQSTAFRANATGLAEAEEDRIIYNTATGQLYFDADGLGGAGVIEFAILEGTPTIDHSDFIVF
ncbi:FG-GAP-like repeat-containing protein [Shimia thalassica]|uniref:FG-GAP-like repeat-containing protein n=1 Tax=Shimia thalassica TaxID=1715693 RepID=UPI0026E34125|nr:FG-GAP-like repeat-containing protein [Shimia thalassica]MDO6481754.1 FG-GAP-like repeat-containing protein [Shimia thalassica]